MTKCLSRGVHGRGWVVGGVPHLQVLTLGRNVRLLKGILLGHSLGGETRDVEFLCILRVEFLNFFNDDVIVM